jgi:hypothetical protein
MRYRCDIDEDLWTMRRNYMIRKREHELREVMRSPRLYMWRNQSDGIEMYRVIFKAIKVNVTELFNFFQWWQFVETLKIMGLAVAIPFILLYMYARAPHYVRERFEEPLNELLEVEYPYEFDGVWGVKRLQAEVIEED